MFLLHPDPSLESGMYEDRMNLMSVIYSFIYYFLRMKNKNKTKTYGGFMAVGAACGGGFACIVEASLLPFTMVGAGVGFLLAVIFFYIDSDESENTERDHMPPSSSADSQIYWNTPADTGSD